MRRVRVEKSGIVDITFVYAVYVDSAVYDDTISLPHYPRWFTVLHPSTVRLLINKRL